MASPEPIPQEVVLEAITELIELGTAELPMSLEPFTPRFKVASAGLLARILTLGESIVHLSETRRSMDLFILVRALYEHLVMLAWISAPRDDSRLDIWFREDNRQRLKLDADIRAYGHAGFSEEDRAFFARQVEEIGGPGLPPLVQLAEQADLDWREYLKPGSATANSLRGSYAIVYRFGSTAAHPTLSALNTVTDQINAHNVVRLELKTDVGWVLPLCVSFLGIALMISSVILGRPDRDAAEAITFRFGREFVRRHSEG